MVRVLGVIVAILFGLAIVAIVSIAGDAAAKRSSDRDYCLKHAYSGAEIRECR